MMMVLQMDLYKLPKGGLVKISIKVLKNKFEKERLAHEIQV